MSATLEVREPEVQAASAAPPVEPQLLPVAFDTTKPLFGDSLLELHRVKKERRVWTTLMSIFLQCGLLGVLILIPLWFTDALPTQQLVTFLVAPPPPPPPPPPPAAQAVVKIVKQIQTDLMSSGQLRTPTRVPAKVAMIREDDAPPPMPMGGGGVVGGVPGGIPGGQLGGVIGGIISATSNTSAVPKLALPAPKRIRISQGVTSGQLIRKVEPVYPAMAKDAHVQGQVILKAIINKNGEIQDLQLITGHVLLAPAAITAVKKWLYRPFLLNGEPVEVETTVTVTFQLAS